MGIWISYHAFGNCNLLSLRKFHGLQNQSLVNLFSMTISWCSLLTTSQYLLLTIVSSTKCQLVIETVKQLHCWFSYYLGTTEGSPNNVHVLISYADEKQRRATLFFPSMGRNVFFILQVNFHGCISKQRLIQSSADGYIINRFALFCTCVMSFLPDSACIHGAIILLLILLLIITIAIITVKCCPACDRFHHPLKSFRCKKYKIWNN